MAYEFEVGGQQYRADKMSGRTQAHVFRRMAPIVGLLMQLAQNDDKSGAILEIAKAFSTLDDEPVDYIIDRCLESVERKQSEQIWTALKPKNVSRVMFSDIDMSDEMEIVGHVAYLNFWPLLKKNLQRIKSGLPSST